MISTDQQQAFFFGKLTFLLLLIKNMQKKKVLGEMDENIFAVIDFAMKFLSRRYCKSMANWFGKAGVGMHVSCVIMKDAERANPN